MYKYVGNVYCTGIVYCITFTGSRRGYILNTIIITLLVEISFNNIGSTPRANNTFVLYFIHVITHSSIPRARSKCVQSERSRGSCRNRKRCTSFRDPILKIEKIGTKTNGFTVFWLYIMYMHHLPPRVCSQ